jgi:hypothetical protein
MRPERPSGAPGCPQAQENGTEHEHPRAESVGTESRTRCAYARAGCAYVGTSRACVGAGCAGDCAYAHAGSGGDACEPDALS